MKSMRSFVPFVLLFCLTGCAMQRADDAAAAKKHMVGMAREEVLACMGPPKRKASEGVTEVWSYMSTDKNAQSIGNSLTSGDFKVSSTSRDKSFCTVNVVMKNGVVSAILYNGPTSSTLFAEDDQCGYAVKNCIPHAEE